MRTFRNLGACLAAALAATLLQSVPAAAATPPDAEVRIDARAFEGPRDMILAGVSGRCAPGFEFSDLIVEFTQGDIVMPSSFGAAFPCDGQWHRQRISSPEGVFDPGPAIVTARLSVTDVVTGDPGKDAVQVQQVYVRAAARVWLPRYATLKWGGIVAMVVRARCDPPWVLPDFFLEARQGSVSASRSLTIPCDGVVRAVPVRLRPATGAFKRGGMRVDAVLSVYDPEHFEPADDATASRWVRVR